MMLTWTEHADVELVPGYSGETPLPMENVRIAIEGGFVHVAIPGSEHTRIFSAPAIRRITYPAAARSDAT